VFFPQLLIFNCLINHNYHHFVALSHSSDNDVYLLFFFFFVPFILSIRSIKTLEEDYQLQNNKNITKKTRKNNIKKHDEATKSKKERKQT